MTAMVSFQVRPGACVAGPGAADRRACLDVLGTPSRRRQRAAALSPEGAGEDAPSRRVPESPGVVSRAGPRTEQPRARPARLRGARTARLHRLWNHGSRFRTSPMPGLWLRAARRLLLQGLDLPLLCHPPHGGRRRSPRPQRVPRRTCAPVGPLLPPPGALPGRPPPGSRLTPARGVPAPSSPGRGGPRGGWGRSNRGPAASPRYSARGAPSISTCISTR